MTLYSQPLQSWNSINERITYFKITLIYWRFKPCGMWCCVTGWLVPYTLRTTVPLKCQEVQTNCTASPTTRLEPAATLLYEPQILQHCLPSYRRQTLKSDTFPHAMHSTQKSVLFIYNIKVCCKFILYCVILNSSSSKPVNWNYGVLVCDAIERSSQTGITGGSTFIFSHTAVSLCLNVHVN